MHHHSPLSAEVGLTYAMLQCLHVLSAAVATQHYTQKTYQNSKHSQFEVFPNTMHQVIVRIKLKMVQKFHKVPQHVDKNYKYTRVIP